MPLLAASPKPTFKRRSICYLLELNGKLTRFYWWENAMLIGYVRVSTNDQNTDLQRNALVSANCEQIFDEKISGKATNRPQLKKAIRNLREGDTLVVWKLDRLGRSVRNLVMLIDEIKE